MVFLSVEMVDELPEDRLCNLLMLFGLESLNCLTIFSVAYRMNGPKPDMMVRVGAQVAGGMMWWWVLWHLFHEYEHITVCC